jgi:hypothetical protein
MADNTGSSGDNVDCSGAAGASEDVEQPTDKLETEDVGELTDEIDADACVNNAGVGSISSGNEEAVEALVALDSAVYRDYFDIFDVLASLRFMRIS